MLKYLKKNYPLFTIFFFCIFYIFRYVNLGYVMYGEEKGFLNYDFVNYRYSSIWDWTTNFGRLSEGLLNNFSMGLFWRLTTFLHLPPALSEYAYFFTIIFAICIFTYLFIQRITGDKNLALLLSLFFITTYQITTVFTSSPKLLHYLVLPVSIYLWSKYIEKKQPIYLALNAFCQFLLLSVGGNLPQIVGAYSFVFLYIFIVDFGKKNFRHMTIFFIPYVFNIIFVGAVNFIILNYNGTIFRYDLFTASTFSATRAYLRDVFRFFGAWWDFEGSGGVSYNNLLWYYQSAIGKIITMAPFALLLYLLTVVKNTALKFKILLLICVVIFLVKGTELPFGFIFRFFYNISVFKIFREPWSKFMPDFIFMITIGLAFLLYKLNRKSPHYIVGMIVIGVITLFQFIPIALGISADHTNSTWRVVDTKIPSYWIDYSKWTQQNAKDKRTLVLPAFSDLDKVIVHLWDPYPFSGDPETYLAYTNVINKSFVLEDKQIISEYLKHLSPALLSISSVDYVLYKNDVQNDPGLIKLDPVKDALDIANKITFDQLDVYPIKNEYRQPRVRTVSRVQTTTTLCDLASLSKVSLSDKSTAFIQMNIPKLEKVEEIPIQTTRLNAGTYKVSFHQAVSGKVGLIFEEQYNRGWGIYDTKNIFARPLLAESDHYPANCFANFWLIPNNSLTNKTLFIRLKPYTSYMTLIWVYSLASLLYIGLSLISHFYRKK